LQLSPTTQVVAITILSFCIPLGAAEPSLAWPKAPQEIKAYDIDFNWGPGGPNARIAVTSTTDTQAAAP
jgi:hypothetical protein